MHQPDDAQRQHRKTLQQLVRNGIQHLADVRHHVEMTRDPSVRNVRRRSEHEQPESRPQILRRLSVRKIGEHHPQKERQAQQPDVGQYVGDGECVFLGKLHLIAPYFFTTRFVAPPIIARRARERNLFFEGQPKNYASNRNGHIRITDAPVSHTRYFWFSPGYPLPTRHFLFRARFAARLSTRLERIFCALLRLSERSGTIEVHLATLSA